MPMPPPPALLFSITGKPIRSASRSAAAASRTMPLPGANGTPADAAKARAVCFSPNSRKCRGCGPMNAIPAAASRSANSARSDRNP